MIAPRGRPASSARAQSLDCAPRCPILRVGATGFRGLFLSAACRFARFRKAGGDDDGLDKPRRRSLDFRLRRRRPLSAAAPAGAAYLRSFARYDHRDRGPHLSSARARARNTGRVRLQPILDAKVGDEHVCRSGAATRSRACRIWTGNGAYAGDDEGYPDEGSQHAVVGRGAGGHAAGPQRRRAAEDLKGNGRGRRFARPRRLRLSGTSRRMRLPPPARWSRPDC